MASLNPRGLGARPLLESEILAAQSVSKSAAEAARRLGVHYATYKKWAMRYGIHDEFIKKSKKGITRTIRNPKKGKYPLDDILKGKHPNFPTFSLKKKLFSCGYKAKQCERCGFNEERDDGEVPLILDYKDGNPRNKLFDNLKILCLNCAFIERGYISRGRTDKKHHQLNLNKIQRERYAVKIETVEIDESKIDNIDMEGLSEDEIHQLMEETKNE